MLRHIGDFVASTPNPREPPVARVSLVESVAIPGQKGRYLKAQIDGDSVLASDVLFEPCYGMIDSLGVCTHESPLDEIGEEPESCLAACRTSSRDE